MIHNRQTQDQSLNEMIGAFSLLGHSDTELIQAGIYQTIFRMICNKQDWEYALDAKIRDMPCNSVTDSLQASINWGLRNMIFHKKTWDSTLNTTIEQFSSMHYESNPENQVSAPSHDLRILSLFMGAIGMAAVAVAFTLLNLSALGACAFGGIALALAGYGIFKSSTNGQPTGSSSLSADSSLSI